MVRFSGRGQRIRGLLIRGGIRESSMSPGTPSTLRGRKCGTAARHVLGSLEKQRGRQPCKTSKPRQG